MYMKVEIWSDYVCPFCYIGERKLEQALDQLEMKDDVEIIFKAFELDPNAALSLNGNINELMAKKYGMSLAQATAAHKRGINGVPYFLFDGKEAVNGAQPVELFMQTIERLG